MLIGVAEGDGLEDQVGHRQAEVADLQVAFQEEVEVLVVEGAVAPGELNN